MNCHPLKCEPPGPGPAPQIQWCVLCEQLGGREDCVWRLSWGAPTCTASVGVSTLNLNMHPVRLLGGREHQVIATQA